LFNLDWSKAADALPLLLAGMKYTIIITIGGLFFGFIIGLAVGLARLSGNKVVYGSAAAFVELIRGTPIVVQALFFYFGINQILHQSGLPVIDEVVAGIAVIAINAGAYIAEIVRGAIQSIDKGQVEAGRSLGLTRTQTFYHIVWPQAFKRMIPPLGNQFIISLKDTSLLAFIGVAELTRKANETASSNFAYFEIFTVAGLLYLAMTMSISLALRRVERRLDSH
jgi:glutamine transport system permease protein